MLKKPTDSTSDNDRLVLMTPSGVARFQPTEFLFSQIKNCLSRLPKTVSVHTASICGFKATLEEIFKSTSNNVTRGCVPLNTSANPGLLVRDQLVVVVSLCLFKWFRSLCSITEIPCITVRRASNVRLNLNKASCTHHYLCLMSTLEHL